MAEPGDRWAFELPSLGADMERGTVLEWYVHPGDDVARGDLVALVSTEKADIDVEIWRAGVVAEHLVAVGEEVPVGTPILALDGAGALAPVVAEQAVAPEKAVAPEAPVASPVRVLASPRARVVASERDVDLGALAGTGPDGAVLVRDVLKSDVLPSDVSPTPQPAKAPTEDRSTGMRRAIAERMAVANRTIPHYHLDLDVELGGARAWLEDHNESLSMRERVLPAALFIKAVGTAAAAVPELNGTWVDDAFVAAERVDVAVAISLRTGGLVTPAIRDVDTKTVDEIMADLQALVAGARRGSLRSSWMADAGITVSNLGDQGADRVGGVVFPPQVALVGFGRVRKRPWVVDGAVEVRPVVTVTLAADHRATDGATGSRFLHALAGALSASATNNAVLEEKEES
ncbi:MAG: dihydrolipoamide acetyltransferase family protein [Acidimicrobiales bacterium]